MRFIDLDGNTWDGKPLMSKVHHDDKYGAFISLGWLVSKSVPAFTNKLDMVETVCNSFDDTCVMQGDCVDCPYNEFRKAIGREGCRTAFILEEVTKNDK